MKLTDTEGIKRVFTIRDQKTGSNAVDVFIIIGKENESSIIVPQSGKFEYVDKTLYDFETEQTTL